jgi:hypothetical protein
MASSALDESLAELASVSRLARLGSWLLRIFGRPDPVAVLRRRGALLDEFQKEMKGLPAVPRDDGAEPPQVMLIPAARYRTAARLPADRRLVAFRPWCWTLLSVAALDREQGSLVVHLGTPLRIKVSRRGTARETVGDDEDQVVYLFGVLPLERIRYIDWYEATDHQTPRVYGQYRWRSPIREVFATAIDASKDPFGMKRYPKVEEIKRFKPRRWHRIRAFRFDLKQRRLERDHQQQQQSRQ